MSKKSGHIPGYVSWEQGVTICPHHKNFIIEISIKTETNTEETRTKWKRGSDRKRLLIQGTRKCKDERVSGFKRRVIKKEYITLYLQLECIAITHALRL